MIRRSLIIDPMARGVRVLFEDLEQPVDSRGETVAGCLIGTKETSTVHIGNSLALITDRVGPFRVNAVFFQFGVFPPPIAGKCILVKCATKMVDGEEVYDEPLVDMMHTEAMILTQIHWMERDVALASLLSMGIDGSFFNTIPKNEFRPKLRAVK